MGIYDVMIIGAGPAGLFAAARCAEAGLDTCLVESNSRAGKKLLITGQGMCNITNSLPTADFIGRYGGRDRFVRKCIHAFSNRDLIGFLHASGLETEEREDGKVFPRSRNAGDVLKLLLKLCRKSDVSFKYSSKIDSISRTGDGFFETGPVSSGSAADILRSSRLIISTGGFTYPATGSDGSGFSLARQLGHNVIAPRPSLAGVSIRQDDFKVLAGCAGISLECGMDIYRDGRKILSRQGSLLFTHKGLSGPLVIDNSRNIRPGDELRLNLLAGASPEGGAGLGHADKAFLDFAAAGGKRAVKSFFTAAGVPDRLAAALMSSVSAAAAPGGKVLPARAAELPAGLRKNLIRAFTALPLTVESLDGRNKAMCTAGGVDTKELNPASMESRLVPGLYFAGEVIDVDGDSGGFNLQFAFSSAAAAASGIIGSLSSGAASGAK